MYERYATVKWNLLAAVAELSSRARRAHGERSESEFNIERARAESA